MRNPRLTMREEVVWVGDGLAADGKKQIGRRVNIDGRWGTVVDASDLCITIEWDKGALKAAGSLVTLFRKWWEALLEWVR